MSNQKAEVFIVEDINIGLNEDISIRTYSDSEHILLSIARVYDYAELELDDKQLNELIKALVKVKTFRRTNNFLKRMFFKIFKKKSS